MKTRMQNSWTVSPSSSCCRVSPAATSSAGEEADESCALLAWPGSKGLDAAREFVISARDVFRSEFEHGSVRVIDELGLADDLIRLELSCKELEHLHQSLSS